MRLIQAVRTLTQYLALGVVVTVAQTVFLARIPRSIRESDFVCTECAVIVPFTVSSVTVFVNDVISGGQSKHRNPSCLSLRIISLEFRHEMAAQTNLPFTHRMNCTLGLAIENGTK